MLHIDNFVCVCKIMKIVDIYFHTWKNFQSTKNYSQLSNWNNLHLIKCICCLMRMYRFGNNMIITNYFSDSFISYLLKKFCHFFTKIKLKKEFILQTKWSDELCSRWNLNNTYHNFVACDLQFGSSSVWHLILFKGWMIHFYLNQTNAFERNIKIDLTKTNIHFVLWKWNIGIVLIVTIEVSLFLFDNVFNCNVNTELLIYIFDC